MFNIKYIHTAWVADAISIHDGSGKNCPHYMYIFLFFGMWHIFFHTYLEFTTMCCQRHAGQNGVAERVTAN
jgi:hypothetical protein